MKQEFSERTNKLLNNVQYFLSAVIAVCFGIGLIPTLYDDVFKVVMVALSIQIVVSLLRVRLFNVLLEVFLVAFGFSSLIPVFGYVFRFLGIIFSVFEMASFKNFVLYRQMEMKTFHSNAGGKKAGGGGKKAGVKKGVSGRGKVMDAEFSEK